MHKESYTQQKTDMNTQIDPENRTQQTAMNKDGQNKVIAAERDSNFNSQR